MQTSTADSKSAAPAVAPLGAHNTANPVDAGETKPIPTIGEICPFGTMAKLTQLQNKISEISNILGLMRDGELTI